MAVQANTDIRAYAIVKGVKLWQLAKYLGYVHENNFSRRLREELPEETKKEFLYPGIFTAAGRAYPSWKALCVEQDETGHFCKDIYGRDVFCMSERFPCFDSFDYANETRRYRWFFLKEKGKLTRVYYADERKKIQVTEDVRDLENNCREQMQQLGWLK